MLQAGGLVEWLAPVWLGGAWTVCLPTPLFMQLSLLKKHLLRYIKNAQILIYRLMNFDMCVHSCNGHPDQDIEHSYQFFSTLTYVTHPSSLPRFGQPLVCPCNCFVLPGLFFSCSLLTYSVLAETSSLPRMAWEPALSVLAAVRS